MPIKKRTGEFATYDFTLNQMDIHSKYRARFNTVDRHNALRQGHSCIEKSVRTLRWWVRDFQALLGISHVNAYLAWRYFKHGQASLPQHTFMRRLAYQLCTNPEVQTTRFTRGCGSRTHDLVKAPGKRAVRTCTVAGCTRKSRWYCICGNAPVMTTRGDANDKGKRQAQPHCYFVCGKEHPECLAAHKHEAAQRAKNSQRCSVDMPMCALYSSLCSANVRYPPLRTVHGAAGVILGGAVVGHVTINEHGDGRNLIISVSI